MTFVGRHLSLALVVALLVLAAGTVGVTVLYQSGVSAVTSQNEQLRTQNERLREELRSARDRIQELRSRVAALEDRVAELRSRVQAQNETIASLRAERDASRADLRSLCRKWSQRNETVPPECENVDWQ
ncbi:MAG: hypothetical protein ABEK02_02350 [Haloquadratum sp.]